MHNISTIYRFYTPFLDIDNEKNNLTGVMKKIEKSLVFDGIQFERKTEELDKYYKISLIFKCNEDNFNVKNISKNKTQRFLPIFNCNMGKIDFYYIKSLNTKEYFLPIFKMDIYINQKFLLNNKTKKRAILFLNNIHECFDGLTEKEYLIDLDDSLYYRKGFFRSKKYPNHDFRNLEEIRKKFESRGGVKLLENFIINLQNGDFILTKQNSNKYHNFYGMLLYFLYLVYIMHLNIIKTSKTVKELEDLGSKFQNDGHIILMKNRLKIVDELNLITYKNYKEKLKIFFNLLK